MKSAVVGNITLDVLCSPVNSVPRYDSLAFDEVYIGPGGCGSNVAIGLCSLGVETSLVGVIGDDPAAELVKNYWNGFDLDFTYIRSVAGAKTGISVGLIDSDAQPRFIHTSGANRFLTPDDIKIEDFIKNNFQWLHIGGYFVLPGLMDESLGLVLAQAQENGIKTSLDVVDTPQMDKNTLLWSCLSNVDYFLCNFREARKLTGLGDPLKASIYLQELGCKTVIIKLGADGCFVNGEGECKYIPAPEVSPIDTTGAGDAFVAALIKSLLDGKCVDKACMDATEAGAYITTVFGATTAWSIDRYF